MTLLLQVLGVLGGVGDGEFLYGCFKQELEAVGVIWSACVFRSGC